MAPKTQVIRWGIISTGGISTSFAKDLLVNPATRDVSDVEHRITAIGSRTVESAQSFLDKLKKQDSPFDWGSKNGILDKCKAYGTYDEVYNDPNVDAIYIGTPHPMHHLNAKGGLMGGKHVLCEKPFTMDMEELDELFKIATEKNLFVMEAVWTRFHPIAYAVQDVIFSGKLGKIKRMSADFSMDMDPDNSNRMIDPKLGGGSLLDMGPYPSVWAMLVMHHHPDNKGSTPKLVNSYQTIIKNRTGVDSVSRWIVEWDNVGQAHLTTDMTTTGLKDNTCTISCEKGDLVLEWGPFKPQRFWIHPHPAGHAGSDSIKETTEHKYPVHDGAGYHYQADELARCVRDGKLQSERMLWEESRIVQGWFDKVRKDGDSVLKNYKGTAGQ